MFSRRRRSRLSVGGGQSGAYVETVTIESHPSITVGNSPGVKLRAKPASTQMGEMERLPRTLVKAPLSAIDAPRYLILHKDECLGNTVWSLVLRQQNHALGRVESDSWQRYALKADSRQRIALTTSFSRISVLGKQRASAGRRGKLMA